MDEPLYFVDFLREPVVDDETGEVLEAHPSNYEAVPGGLVEIRSRVEALQRKFNEDSKVRRAHAFPDILGHSPADESNTRLLASMAHVACCASSTSRLCHTPLEDAHLPPVSAFIVQMLKLNLVLFTDALLHLMRVSRLLAMARGSGLLVGVGGSGKQSLARLAAYINGATTFQITVTKVWVTTFQPDFASIFRPRGCQLLRGTAKFGRLDHRCRMSSDHHTLQQQLIACLYSCHCRRLTTSPTCWRTSRACTRLLVSRGSRFASCSQMLRSRTRPSWSTSTSSS